MKLQKRYYGTIQVVKFEAFYCSFSRAEMGQRIEHVPCTLSRFSLSNLNIKCIHMHSKTKYIKQVEVHDLMYMLHMHQIIIPSSKNFNVFVSVQNTFTYKCVHLLWRVSTSADSQILIGLRRIEFASEVISPLK